MISSLSSRATAALLLLGSLVSAVELDVSSQDSIKTAAATIAYDMMTVYKGNQSGGIPGVLPGPPPDPPWGYFWWQGGAMWGVLIDYWHYTGDTSYNDAIQEGIQFQTGEANDMMPSNWSNSMGNDDQGFWGMTAMTAAETNFQNPPNDRPGWLELAQAVFNTQAVRKDMECGGGLRWQVYPWLTGYDYKNAIANGCFFNIGARLAAYTKNDTYAKHAEDKWNWMTNVGMIDEHYNVFDGAHVTLNCTDINPVRFSYNAAVWLLGAATMYEYTNGSAVWEARVRGLLNSTLPYFFPGGIAFEPSCEPTLGCSTDMYSFKAYLTRWLAQTTKVAPFTRDLIVPVLKTSAEAAAKQCVGGDTGRWCGHSWSKGEIWDGTQGVGQQMGAMSAIFTSLLQFDDGVNIAAPYSNTTGGTSKGNPNAGADSVDNPEAIDPATKSDRAGAGIITTLMLASATGLFGWMSI